MFKSILLVDDSEAEQFLYRNLIEAYNPEAIVDSVYDGQEALEFLAKHDSKPDCILLDINMPRMNGFEFLEEYSKIYNNKHVVVSMLTSSIQEADKQRALSFECVNDFFTKPITLEDLKKLDTLVEEKES